MAKRPAGSFANNFAANAASHAGTRGFSDRKSAAGSSTTFRSTSYRFAPRNGLWPVSEACSTAPRAKRSARPSQGSPRTCSGAIYSGVPAATPVPVRAVTPDAPPAPKSAARARPKSATRTRSTPRSNRMFAGFTSRWISPCAWAAASPNATCRATRTAAVTVSGPAVANRPARVSPGT